MAIIAEVKKDMEFYQDFGSLIEAIKAITVSQFHALEKKFKFVTGDKAFKGMKGVIFLK